MLAERMMMGTGGERIPTGLIIPFNDVAANIPAGWARFTSADNKHPVGAGDTYAVAATGGAALSFSRTSSSDGAHTGLPVNLFVCVKSGIDSAVAYCGNGAVSAGAHTHTISGTYEMFYRTLVLMKASANHKYFPSNAIVFGKESTSPVSGLTHTYEIGGGCVDRLLRSGSVAATGGGWSDHACSEDGYHIHSTSPNCMGGAYNGQKSEYSDPATHSHSLPSMRVSATYTHVKRTWLAAWSATFGFRGARGIIAMWEGTTAPVGWYLCDGNNGTLDMRNHYLQISTAANIGNQELDGGSIWVEASLNSNTWYHEHFGGTQVNVETIGCSHAEHYATHSHTSTSAWEGYYPPYYALTFIEKA